MSVNLSKGNVVSVKYGRDGRSKTTELATSEPSVVLAVSTFHRTGGSYRTTAMGVRHMPSERGFSITKSSPMDSALVGTVNEGTRFSRKTLDSAHAAMVREAGDRLVDGEFAAVLAATPGERD
jgi:hypothetical protein